MTAEQKQALIDEIVIQALRDDVRQWQQRAEAAESNSNYNGGDARYWHDEYCAQQQRLVSKIVALEERLAELAKQEPVHFRPFGSDGETYVKCSPDHIDAMAFWQHPAPAADLAELVPEEIPRVWDGTRFKYVKDSVRYAANYANGHNACRAEMLRNIEEAE